MTAEELIKRAAACQDCGREHEYVKTGPFTASWAARDGHSYRPVLDTGTVAALRMLATGTYTDPWVPVKHGPLSRGHA